jgi:hypothetical protein
MNDELKSLWKKLVVAYLKVQFRGGGGRRMKTMKYFKNIVDVLAEIRTGHLTNIDQKHYRLSQSPP